VDTLCKEKTGDGMADDQERVAAWPASRPLVKWTGGKRSELPQIRASLPPRFERLLEPFVGGGAVLFATPAAVPALANDACEDLVCLYRALAARDACAMAAVGRVEDAWLAVGAVDADPDRGDAEIAAEAVTAAAPIEGLAGGVPAPWLREAMSRALARKRAALARFAARGDDASDGGRLLSSGLRSAVYEGVRLAYNDALPGPERSALFWFLRDFCYGGLFRRNGAGRFNAPYGGMSYDRRSMAGRLEQLRSPEVAARLAATRFSLGDFEPFLASAAPGDLVFIDPPYDSRFTAYDGTPFGRGDHARLARAVAMLPCAWMMVIARTPFVEETYCSLPGVRVREFDKTYATNIKQRFDRRAVHLVVTNY
jgi:DNA adenine methylase